jgi:mersacidin/lichenicidin family type 2 lantibiotic
MSNKDIVRAWKDEAYRNSLSPAERAMLPESPAGSVELTDAELELTAGGALPYDTYLCTWTCPTVGCTVWSWCRC